MKKILILGSTGSIGTQALEIAERSDELEVVGLAAGSNGVIARNSTASRSTPGRRSSRLAATFAPFENPTAHSRAQSRP